MPPGEDIPNVVRLVEGVEGEVSMRMELIIRFDSGWVVPWVRTIEGVLHAVGGPDALALRTPVKHHGEDRMTVAEFKVRGGERVPFVLTWHPSNTPAPGPIDAEAAISNADCNAPAYLPHPANGNPLRSVAPDGVTLSPVGSFTFDGLGRPSGATTIVVSSSIPDDPARQIAVAAETGYVSR